jgi:hypothetical protein
VQSTPYYSYSKTEFWPKGAWGRNYEDSPDLSECNPGDVSGEGKVQSNGNYTFFKSDLACYPAIRDASFFLQGHIHMYLTGYNSTRNKIKISMGVKGRALENSYIERFWRALKYEHIYLNSANGGIELYEGVRKYIEFYNTERRHTSIKKIPLKNILIQLVRIPKINLYLFYPCPK